VEKKRLPLFLIPVLIFFTSPTVSAQEQAPEPVHKDGQTWHFQITETHKGVSRSDAFNGLYELRIAGDKIQVVKLIDGQREPVTTRSSTLRELLGKTQGDDPDFKFPLTVGQKWSYDYQANPTGAKKPVRRLVEINVTGIEQVTTQAGTFKAFKVRKENSRPGSKGQLWVTEHYWSSETNSVVKSFYDTTEGGGLGTIREVELVKFTKP
jgi:hypothetical protein